MSKRLDQLVRSRDKKQAELDRLFAAHFEDVKSANGQPLNDKRNGPATLARWERQSQAIRRMQDSLAKTDAAIEAETLKIRAVERSKDQLPAPLLEMVEAGKLIQWRKHPNTFFVPGVDKARIVWDAKRRVICHKYARSGIADQAQWSKFATVFNTLSAQIRALDTAEN